MADEPTATTTVQSVIPRSLAAELRARAAIERRSLSATIRCAIEDGLRPPPPLARTTDYSDARDPS